MTNADIALVVSIVAVIFSALTLGWTIRRDTLRPRVRVRWAVNMIIEPGMAREDIPEYLMLGLTNMGPSTARLQMAQLGYSRWWERRWLLLKGKYVSAAVPHSVAGFDQLPHVLDVGESINVAFPIDCDMATKDEFDRIGVFDSFGRNHWCTRKVFLATRQSARQKVKKT